MAMPKITGRVEILVNGNLLLNKAGAKATGIGKSGEQSFEYEAVNGDTGIHGYIEKPIPAGLEVNITDRDDIMLDTLARIRGDGTIIFRTIGGGKVYTMNNATCLGNFTVTAGQGETTVKFTGPYWIESTESA